MKTTRPWIWHALMFIDDPAAGDGGGGGDGGQQTPPQPPAPTFTQEDVNKAVQERLARERAKYADHDALKAKAAELDQIKAAQKTAEERAAEELAQARKAAADAAAEAARFRAAATHSVAGDDIDLIGVGDQETVMARAERVGQLLAAERELEALKAAQQQGTVPATGRPRPVLRPGATPVEEAGRVASDDAAREAALRRGRIATPQPNPN